MSGKASVNIIDPDRHYKYGDIICGKAQLNLSSSTRVSLIEIKLCCREYVTVSYDGTSGDGYSYRGKDVRREKTITLSHPALLNDTGSQGASVLTPGRYLYPFEFKIPTSNNIYCPTFKTDAGGIKWYVKVVVRREGRFQSDIRGEKQFTLIHPHDSLAALGEAVRESISSLISEGYPLVSNLTVPQGRYANKVDIEFQELPLKQQACKFSVWKKFPSKTLSESEGSDRLRISVEEIVEATANKHRGMTMERLDYFLTYNSTGKVDNSNLTNAINRMIFFGDELTPNFRSRCFSVRHEVEVEGAFASRHNPDHRETVVLRMKYPNS